MKIITSTRVLVATILLVPISLVMYNRLLKDEYLEGHIKQEIYETDKLVDMAKQELKPFNHLVVNGAVVARDTTIATFMPAVEVKTDARQKNAVYVLKQITSLMKYAYKHDTLFVTLEKDRVNPDIIADRIARYSIPTLVFYVSGLQSFACKNGKFKVQFLKNKQFDLSTGSNCQVQLDALTVNQLNISADKTWVLIEPSCTITNLAYSLYNEASIDIKHSGSVQTRTAVHAPGYVEAKNESVAIIKSVVETMR